MKRRSIVAGLGGLMTACAPAATAPRLLSEAPIRVQPAAPPPPPTFPPVQFPRDEAPHDVLAEWWYYTGHLYTVAGATTLEAAERGGVLHGGQRATELPTQEFGFELVFFRGIRGDRPPGYAAHFAVTDLARQRFRYDQRQDIALREQAVPTIAGGNGVRPPGVVAVNPPGGGFDLALGNWSIRGALGRDHIRASMNGYTIDLELVAMKPPALHFGDPPIQPGLISLGRAGYSYYYSRTRMHARGTIAIDGGPPIPVIGDVWMDHQWGDFLVLGGGGWDWFAGNLRDGRDVTISIVRDEQGRITHAHGTLVEPNGQTRHLPQSSFRLTPIDTWISPHTGIVYPSGWRVVIPSQGVDLLWLPLLRDQELDTRASTGVIYWEGAVALLDAQTRQDVGRGYVELTGYSARS